MALACVACFAGAEAIVDARYEMPTERYGHFAPGRPHEYARLVATTDAGRRLALDLPANEVFEDVVPRVVPSGDGGAAEILAVVSGRAVGSGLALVGLAAGRLAIVARSAPLGTPMRWLNPLPVADLDGDGSAEIAAVTTPHIGGVLRLYRRTGDRLVEVDALEGFSNHVYGSAELGLSAVARFDGWPHWLVPDRSRTALRLVTVENGRLAEYGRCELPGKVIGALRPEGKDTVSVGLDTGRYRVDLRRCSGGRPIVN